MKKTLILVCLLASITLVRLPTRPRIYFHGLGGECDENPSMPDNSVADPTPDLVRTDLEFCLETGAGAKSSINIEKQGKTACEKVVELVFNGEKIRPEFSWGFHLIGHSQGGLLARLMYNHCPQIHPWVATLTTDGTPNDGIDSLPDMKKFGMTEHKILAGIVNGIGKVISAMAKFFRNEQAISFLEYLNSKKKPSKMMERLNFKPNYTYENLELVNLIMYLEDYAVTPRTSSAFRVDFDETADKWNPFSDSPHFYKLGFSQLYMDSRLNVCRAVGTHLDMNWEETKDFLFLTRDECEYPGDLKNYKMVRQAYRNCSRAKLVNRIYGGLKCHRYEPLMIMPDPKGGQGATQKLIRRI